MNFVSLPDKTFIHKYTLKIVKESMKDLFYDTRDPVAALATPWGESALAVIRTSGEDVIPLFSKVFSRPERILSAKEFTIHYGYILDPETGKRIDQITAAVYHAPKSYTGQDSVEIFCHGSLPGIQSILDVLKKSGFRDAAPGEFTLRAFLNGKMDLSQAEAVAEIVEAKSLKAHSLALNRLSGGVFKEIDRIKHLLLDFMGVVEVQLDYPDDEIGGDAELSSRAVNDALKGIRALLATYDIGKLYKEGITVAFAGGTNAGKSSLFNLFLKEDRSIVSDIDGTTRDYIESWITLKGIPLRLFDTAGLRESQHPVEKEGIRRSSKIISGAAVVLYVIDGEKGLSAEDERIIMRHRENPKYLFLWNKMDRDAKTPPEWALPISAVTGEGFLELENKLFAGILGEKDSSGSVMIDSLRQKDLLERAAGSLQEVQRGIAEGVSLDGIAVDLKDGLDALGEITGEVTSRDILDTIFSGFCVGK